MNGNGKKENGSKKVGKPKKGMKREKKAENGSKLPKEVKLASVRQKSAKITRQGGFHSVKFVAVVSLRGYSMNGVLYAVGIPMALSEKLGISGGEIAKVTVELTGRNIISERVEKRARRMREAVERADERKKMQNSSLYPQGGYNRSSASSLRKEKGVRQ